eukprot:Rmarinus@m.14743
MEAHRAPPETLRMFEEEAEIEPVSFEAPQLPLPAVEYFSEGELEFPAAPVLSPRPEMDMEMSPPPAEVSIQPAWPEEELPEVPLMRETRKRKRSQQGLQIDVELELSNQIMKNAIATTDDVVRDGPALFRLVPTPFRDRLDMPTLHGLSNHLLEIFPKKVRKTMRKPTKPEVSEVPELGPWMETELEPPEMIREAEERVSSIGLGPEFEIRTPSIRPPTPHPSLTGEEEFEQLERRTRRSISTGRFSVDERVSGVGLGEMPVISPEAYESEEEAIPYPVGLKDPFTIKFLQFLRQRMEGIDKASFFELSESSRRLPAARAFFQLLVLKGIGVIDVKQSDAYGDITISKTPLFEAH